MKEILQNLAMIHLNKFCMLNGIDISGTHVEKVDRTYLYWLVKTETDEMLAGVAFSKSRIPLYKYFPDHPEWIAARERGIIEP